MSKRYSVNKDPGGLFYIWDERQFTPIMDGEKVLAFVTIKEANLAAYKLNVAANDNRRSRNSRPSRPVKSSGWPPSWLIPQDVPAT